MVFGPPFRETDSSRITATEAASRQKLFLRVAGILGPHLRLLLVVIVKRLAEKIEQPVREPGERRTISEPREERAVEAKQAGQIRPLASQIKFGLAKFFPIRPQPDVGKFLPPAVVAEIPEKAHAVLFDLHEPAANAIGRDEIIGDDQPVQIDRIAEHW